MDFLTGGRWEHPLHRLGCHDGDGIRDEHPHGDARRMSLELGAAQVIGGLVTVGWLAIAAHELTKRQVGDLMYIVTLGGLVGLGTDLGVPLALAKVSCDYDNLDRGAVYAAVGRRITAGWLAAILLIVVWSSGHHSAHWWLAAVYGISVVTATVSSSALAALRGRAIGIVEAGYQLASQVVLAALALVALQAGAGLYGVIIAYVAVDAMFACPALTADQLLSKYVPTYAYEFNDENAPERYLPPVGFSYGAAHESEVQYLFDLQNTTFPGGLSSQQQRLAAAMKQYWTAFAKVGAPLSTTVLWPPFGTTSARMLSLVPPRPGIETDFAVEHNCAFWAGMG